MKSMLTCAVAIILLAALGAAQQSPEVETSVKLIGKTVAIKYVTPSMAGRKIFGALVPYGKVWPVGGAPAALHTDAAIEIQGLSVPKGDYWLYVLPDVKVWQLIVNKQTGTKASSYDPKMDVGRVRMRVTSAGAPIETFKVTVSGTGMAGKLELGWES